MIGVSYSTSFIILYSIHVFFQLDSAYENVTKEMHKLDHRGDAVHNEVRIIFDEVLNESLDHSEHIRDILNYVVSVTNSKTFHNLC